MAGLRVGYAVAAPEVARWLRAVGQPYAVSGPSLALAAHAFESEPAWLAEHVGRVRSEREALCELLADLGGRPYVSQANFVLSAFDDPVWVADALAGFGVAVRRFTAPPEVRDCLRITCPGSVDQWRRLEHALRTALAPQALLFDMDGVLADVSRSFRACIVATARSFGIDVSADQVHEAKMAGDATDDWLLTWRLVRNAGGSATVADVTARFEALYQGIDGAPGLRRHETLLAPVTLLAELGRRLPMAVVTGRPRADALRFLREQGVEDLFPVVVTRDDAPLKPSPEPLHSALRQLGVERAWMIGDTPDDLRAARAAGVLPIGILAPGETDEAGLFAAGASRVLATLSQIQEVLR
jgi:HAD superfamily hydrolase (TIGR01548 family)